MGQSIELKKNKDGIWEIELPKPDIYQRGGVLGDLGMIKLGGVPIGEAAIGGTVALIVAELVDGLIKPRFPQLGNLPPAVINLASAWAVLKWGEKLIGTDAAKAAAMFLAFQAARDLVPLDVWIRQFFSGVQTAGQNSATTQPSGNSIPTTSRLAWTNV